MTRRTTGSPEKKLDLKKDEDSRKRKSAQPLDMMGESSRPKRNIKKSTLFTSGDYEVSFPGTGVVKEEEEEEEELVEDDYGAGEQMLPVPEVVEAVVQRPPAPKGRPRRPPPSITPIQRDDQRSDVEVDIGSQNSEQDEENAAMGDFDIDHLATEVDVETMSNLEEAEHVEMMKRFAYEENEEAPPILERASDAKRKRGRPRKYPQGQTPFRRTNNQTRRSQVQRDPSAPSPRNKYTYDKPLTKIEAEKINSFNVKLFDDHIGVTENGDVYATVIPGCLSYLLRKERIIELLTSRTEINQIREQGWMMSKPPRLPPLSPHKVCYAFYIEGCAITSIRDLSSDDLKPWTTSSNDPAHNEPVVKPNVRKHPIMRQGGRLVPTKGDPRGAEIHLTEYSAWLPRCLRLRKKIFYLSRAGHIIGNVLILYDFTVPGEIPLLLNVVHGNEAFRGNHTDEEFERGHMLFVGDNENPFEEDMVSGPRGERFFAVRHDRYGWTNNKKLLLKWLINDPSLLEAPGSLNNRIPYLPPLIEGRGVFVYFAPAAIIADQLHFTGDGLSPWTYQGASVNHRVRTVKKGLVQDSLGLFTTTKEEWQATGLALVETITILCRCPRLRKRIIYVQRSNTAILGNVAYIYEYMQPGPIPDIVKQNNRASTASLPPQEVIMRPHQVKAERSIMNDDDVDVEGELVEEVVSDDLHHHGLVGPNYAEDIPYEELPEDSLNGGWDTEFEEDVLVSQESTSPFFEGVRHLEDGHMYLTVRHKRVLCNSETILEFIANSNFVDEKGLMNTSKPSHPPLVRNARAYVFFVSGHVVFPHDINRDDFSPWSANATPDRPTCYRSKVRKFGVACEPKTARYILQDGDYKQFPFHLVSLYSIHPKEDRLRKRIHYLMETSTKTIVSHVMIMYDYNQEGMIPRINGPYGKRMIKRRPAIRRMNCEVREVFDDVSEESEAEPKPSPFGGSDVTEQGDVYMVVDDIDFLNDRNHQLHYLINNSQTLLDPNIINPRVPQFPPMVETSGAYAFFVDGQVDNRMLNCDGLGPWTENVALNDDRILCKRPKSYRLLLGFNRRNQLRVVRNKKYPPAESDWQMHIYGATLPRCPRLKKRVIYITKDNAQYGLALIIYWYSEAGPIPQLVSHGNAIHADNYFNRIPPPIKEEARELLLKNISSVEVLKTLQEKHNIPLHLKSIYNIKRELRAEGLLPNDPNEIIPKDVKDSNLTFDAEDSMADYVPPEWEDQRMVDDDGVVRGRRLPQPPLPPRLNLDAQHLFRYVKNIIGCRNDAEAFDAIWKSLVLKDEQRVLRNIKADFGVEIVADHVDHSLQQEQDQIEDGAIIHEEILDGEIIGEAVLAEGDIIEEEVVMDESAMILIRDRDEESESILLQEPSEVPKEDDSSPIDPQ